MHKFKCPDDGEFEAKRSFRAHCPKCGKNCQRIFEPGEKDEAGTRPESKEDDSKAKETSENPESTEETKQDTKEEKQPSGESLQPTRPTEANHRPKRIKVTRDQTNQAKETKGDTGESSTSTPAKKIKIKRGAAPKVSKKIVTTRDRKMNKEKKEERATHWTTVKRFKIF